MTCRPLVLTSLLNQLKALSRGLNELSVEATRVGNAIDEVEEYSYQFNVKIIGLPEKRSETAAETSALCVKLFQEMGGQKCFCPTLTSLVAFPRGSYMAPRNQSSANL